MIITIEGVGVALGLIVAGSIVTGLAVRLILLPYLEKYLLAPVLSKMQAMTEDMLHVKTEVSDVKADVSLVKKQVENSHTTNLRDDLTEAIDLLRDLKRDA